ncbi:MAG: tetratricopeptide repeat-containing protein [Maricaulaceae bacterium]
MPNHTSTDYLKTYDAALVALKTSPDDASLKYDAVLSLARAGSLEFALAEHKRYKLGNIKSDEDIMSLSGRLYKDLCLKHTGKEALHWARESTLSYEAAFRATHGYYSGINSATMAFLAEMPKDIIKARAENILKMLPQSDNLPIADLYFLNATRAEAWLLLDNILQTQSCLQAAINHDPLNYTAHATTLKQFRMILNKRGGDQNWLNKFMPPKTVYYAGHIFESDTDRNKESMHTQSLSTVDIDALKLKISHVIQREDIGFGYGALAAGSDILIAEALLAEGAELNVILPTQIEAYLNTSVRSFGDIWIKKFHMCLNQAASVKIYNAPENWMQAIVNKQVGQFTMGQAIMRSQTLMSKAAQIILWDGGVDTTFTAEHVKDWAQTQRDQYIIDYPKPRPNRNKSLKSGTPSILTTSLMRSDQKARVTYPSISEAAKEAMLLIEKHSDIKIALHSGFHEGPERDDLMQRLLHKGLPQGVILSEEAACLIALEASDLFRAGYVGQVKDAGNLRAFALKRHTQ